ncbi:hypothetical protein KIW84_055898, partial [Lathyrus oleraceus]
SLEFKRLFEMKSLEANGLRHLSSLERLYFIDCPELVSLSEKAFPSSLKTLYVWNCPRLNSLPEKVFPSSLKTLYFWNCPRLESLPEDSLPTFLEKLTITSCPLLEERYKRNEYWSKIAHIPAIKINDQLTI